MPACRLSIITQNRGLERVMKRLSSHFSYELCVHESCLEFISHLEADEKGVVVVDAAICSQARLMDLQMVLSEAPSWQVIYLPETNKKTEIKEAISVGVFGCLHKPISEKEVQQMVQSAMGL